MSSTPPDDHTLLLQADALLREEPNFIANAANLSALVYHELANVNWAGFYFCDADGLVLGPFVGRPACTRLPSGRGVCGAAVKSKHTLVVDDVGAFADHIVCDSASQSEIVIPLFHDGRVYGVFDIDSPVKARFTPADRASLEAIVHRFQELAPPPPWLA